MRAAFLALSFFHNLREDGGKEGSSHFDRTPQYAALYFMLLLNYIACFFLVHVVHNKFVPLLFPHDLMPEAPFDARRFID